MYTFRKTGLALVFSAACGLASLMPALAGSLVVTDVAPTPAGAQALVNRLLGPGVTVVGTPTLVGNQDTGGAQQGTFTTIGSDVVGFQSGVLLTTGYAQNAVGPNDMAGASQSWDSAGDPDLTALAGVATNDANSLTFTFTVAPDIKNLGFNYAFASEEYNEFVTSEFNDAFGFFVDGTNVALLPGTNDLVSIHNVNLSKNSAYYINNDFQDGSAPRNTQYDGLTIPLFADVSSALNPSLTQHTIKITIADANDSLFDSGVFLQSSSFTQGGAVPEPSQYASFAVGALGLAVLALGARKRKASGLA